MSSAAARVGGDGVAEAFGFEGGHEALSQGVVVGIGGAPHTQGDAAGGGESSEGIGGVLHAAIAEPSGAR